jgi:Xaa-Pro aminopeptidase
MGLETSLRMPLGDYHLLVGMIAPRRVVDATDTVQRVREVKSEAEIARIRATCRIAGAVFDAVPALVAETPRLDTVFRRFQAALLVGGADWVSYVAGGAGQGGYGDVISPAGARPLVPGDVLMLDTGAVRQGYFCDFDRNYAIGPPSDDVRRAHEALHVATDALIGALRPGMTARQAHALLAETLRAGGAELLSPRAPREMPVIEL